MSRRQAGEAVSIDEFVESYPNIAADLKDCIEALLFVDGFKPDSQTTLAAQSDHPSKPNLSDYDLGEIIGRGGMGIVYRARQRSLAREVAVKVLPLSARNRHNAAERFEQEAQIAAQLHHTNIVPVFEVGSENATLYYSMQFIEGNSLDTVIDQARELRAGTQQKDSHSSENSQPLDEMLKRIGSHPTNQSGIPANPFYLNVATIGRQVADALAYAHRHSVIHRDIKPSNLMLDLDGTVWVTDFGLAKWEDSDLTKTGDVVGTLRYMAPERFAGKCDPRSDVYSLGMTLYELLAMRHAFADTDQLTLIESIKNHSPPSLRSIDSKIPLDLQTVVEKAIEKEPARRYSSARELEKDLSRFLNGLPIRARRVGSFEKLLLWTRKHRALAIALGALATLLLATSVVSTWASFHFRETGTNPKATG